MRALMTLPLLALLSWPSAALAETPAEKARRLYDLGNQAYKAGDTKIAQGFYAEAFAAERSFGIALNLGSTELDLGRHRDAAEHLAYALRVGATGIASKVRAAAEQRLAAARAKVGALTVTGAAGCALTLDGTTIGDPEAAELFVEPGEHRLTATCPRQGAEDADRRGNARVMAEAGKSLTVPLSLGASPPPIPIQDKPPLPPTDPGRDLALPLGVGLGVAGTSVVVGSILLGLGADQGAQANRELAQLTGGCGADLALCRSIDGHRRSADDLGIAGLVTLVGGAAVGAAILAVGLATAPRRPPGRAWLTPTGAGFRLAF